ncbi:MAG: hypothetical protein ACK4SN_06710, partial [Bellilinea sp.]
MNQNNLKQKLLIHWLLLIVSLIMILSGILIKILSPQLSLNPYVIISIGLVFSGVAGGNLIKFRLLGKYPEQAHEWAVHEKDERVRLIRWRA